MSGVLEWSDEMFERLIAGISNIYKKLMIIFYLIWVQVLLIGHWIY